MPLIWNDGKLLFVNGSLAFGKACCCGISECCALTSDTTLVAEVTSSTNSCFTVGATVNLTQVAPEIWRSDGDEPWTPNEGWDGLELTCADNVLVLSWDGDGSACPTVQNPMPQISGVCEPFAYVFEVEIDEAVSGVCNCDSGTVQFTLTLAP